MAHRHFVISVDEQEFTFQTGCVLNGLSLSRTDDGWSFSIRAFDRKGNALYARGTGTDIESVTDGLLDTLYSRDGRALWRADKFIRGR